MVNKRYPQNGYPQNGYFVAQDISVNIALLGCETSMSAMCVSDLGKIMALRAFFLVQLPLVEVFYISIWVHRSNPNAAEPCSYIESCSESFWQVSYFSNHIEIFAGL